MFDPSIFVPGICSLLFGVGGFVKYILDLRRIERYTATVTAHIVDMGKVRQRYGYKYFYRVRYEWQDVKYTADFRTIHYLGESKEDTVILIDPDAPGSYRGPVGQGDAISSLVFGLIFGVIGIIFLVSGLASQM